MEPMVNANDSGKKTKRKPKDPDAKGRRPGVVRSGGPRASLSERQVAQIFAFSLIDPRTIRAWADGKPVRKSTDRVCRMTAERIGLDVVERP